MANLTVNTKKYGQITLNTKPHSDPLASPKTRAIFFSKISEVRLHNFKTYVM